MEKTQNSMDSTPNTRTDIQQETRDITNYRKRHSVKAVNIVFRISDGEKIKIKDIPENVYEELQEYNLAFEDDEGIYLVPGPNANNVVGKGMSIVYPFGAYGTIRSYKATLDTQSVGATNAFVSALTDLSVKFFSRVNPLRMTQFTQSLMDCGAFFKVDDDVVYDLYTYSRDLVTKNRNKNRKNTQAVKEIYDDILTLEAQLDDILIKSIVEDVDFQSTIFIDPDIKLKKLISQENDIKLICSNVYTGEEHEYSYTNVTTKLNCHDKVEIIKFVSSF